MSMMTTLCAKTVGQLGNSIKAAGNGPTYFPNRDPLRLNPTLSTTITDTLLMHRTVIVTNPNMLR